LKETAIVNSCYVVARQEIRATIREKTFILLLVIFLGMTLASTYIGWSSGHTIQSVYNSTVVFLQEQGKAIPPPPFESASHLSPLKNMIIYIVLIGTLMAITVGYLMGIRDRIAGVTRIIFSRNITKKQFLLGKVLSILFMLGSMLLIAFIVSTVSSMLLAPITFADVMRIAGFYGFSLVYLASFSFLGLSFALTRNTSAIALLSPIIIWLVITFMLPELTSALYPTASLNPILPQTDVLQSTALNAIHTAVYPLSISEQFKVVAGNILSLPYQPVIVRNFDYPFWLGYISVPIWAVVCLAVSLIAVGKFKKSQGELNE
jgi:ABC-type transport system involved in multi-copper enzyme maturation permease subunit